MLNTLLVTLPALASAHDVFTTTTTTTVNPALGGADRDNAKLNFLDRSARRVGADPNAVAAARSIYNQQYVWSKTTLKVCFWNGTEADQRDIMALAASWHDAVPVLQFNFEDNGKVRICQLSDLRDFRTMSDIRITLSADDPRPLWNAVDAGNKRGDWSYPGKAVAQDPAYPSTMSLAGAVGMRATHEMTGYTFNVRHEFGHALSLVHEHQRSVCQGWFDIPAIAKSQGWTEAFTEIQVGSLAETSNVFGVIGAYDVKSIMQYNFAPSWYKPDLPGQPNPCRRREDVIDLSDLDKIVVAELYDPGRNKDPAVVALLQRARASAAIESPVPASAGTAQEQASAKASVEAALAGFKAGIGQQNKIAIQGFLHPVDQNRVLASLGNLGYPLLDGNGKKIVSYGHPNPTLQGDPTNSVLFTKDVPEQDVRYVALSLLNAGIEVKSIQPYYPGAPNGFRERSNLIQVGSSVLNRKRKPLTVDDILSKKLPMYGESSS